MEDRGAHRAAQESTRTQRDQLRAAIVRQGHILQHQGANGIRHASRARYILFHRQGAHCWQLALAKQATRTLTACARAHRAWQEHTRRLRDLTIAPYAAQTRIQQLGHRHAKVVRQAPAQFKGAQSAFAMRATGGLPEARAQSAVQESTRRQGDQPHAAHVPQASIQQPSGPQSHQHAKVVRQAPARLKGAQSALARRATRGLTVMDRRAQRAVQESTRCQRDRPNARHVPQASFQ